MDALKCLFEKYDFYFVTYIYPLLWYKNIYTMKKIKYTEKRLRNNFRIGLLFIALGIMFFLIPYVVGVGKYDFLFKAVGIGEIAGGIFGLIIYYYESKNQYLTFKNGELTKHTLFPKSVKLSDVKSIKEFAGDIKLIIDKKEFVIDTNVIEPSSLLELRSELQQYELQ